MDAETPAPIRARLQRIRLYLLVTSSLCKGSPIQAAALALKGGADVVQMREKSMGDHDLLALGMAYRTLCDEHDALFIVNDRPDIARLCHADGVHLGQDDLPVDQARRILLPEQVVGVSTHYIDQARAAVEAGADYLGVGPVYPSETKGYTDGLGTGYVTQVASETSLPFVALGGITTRGAEDAARAGAPAVAVCSAILQADDIAAAAQAIRAAVVWGISQRDGVDPLSDTP